MRWLPEDLAEWFLGALLLVIVALVVVLVWAAFQGSYGPTCKERGGKEITNTVFILVGKVMVPMPITQCIEGK